MIRVDESRAEALLAAAGRGEAHVHLVRDAAAGREASYDAFAGALELSPSFGRNLDALLDALREVADRHAGTWTLLWWPESSQGPIDDGVLEVLADLEADSPGLEVAVVDAAASTPTLPG